MIRIAALIATLLISASSFAAAPCDSMNVQQCYDMMLIQKLVAMENQTALSDAGLAMAQKKVSDWEKYFSDYVGPPKSEAPEHPPVVAPDPPSHNPTH